MAAAVSAGTPVLVTRHHLSAYTYLDSRSTIMLLEDVDPIVAIGRLRTNGTTLTHEELEGIRSADPSSPAIKGFSWHRSHAEYDAARSSIYRQNVEAMRRIIYGQLPDFSYL